MSVIPAAGRDKKYYRTKTTEGGITNAERQERENDR